MTRLDIYSIIDCPDYGKVKIRKSLTLNDLIIVKKSGKNFNNAFKKLLLSILREEKAKVYNSLSEKDLDYLALEIAKINQVKTIFLYKKKSGKSRSEALILSLRQSFKVMRSDGIIITLTSDPFKRFTEMNFIAKAIAISRNMGITQYMKDYAVFQSKWKELTKGLTFASEIQRSMSSLTFGKTLSEQIGKQSLLVGKSISELIPKMNLAVSVADSYRYMIEEITRSTTLIAQILKPVPSFIDSIKQATASYQAITKEISTLAEPMRLSNLAVLDSLEIVKNTHKYFSQSTPILSIPKIDLPENLIKKHEILINEQENNEQILQVEANESTLVTNTLISNLSRIIRTDFKQDLKEVFNETIAPYIPVLDRMKILANPPSFLNCLKQCLKKISRDYWRTYWKIEGNEYNPNPERLAKSHIYLYIEGFFGGISFVGDEIKSGDGFIDLFISFLGQIYIIEIKIIGESWGIGWAESGIQQLKEYMDAYNQNESYLLILDGRKSDRGRQLQNRYDLEEKKVHVISERIYKKS